MTSFKIPKHNQHESSSKISMAWNLARLPTLYYPHTKEYKTKKIDIYIPRKQIQTRITTKANDT